MKFCPVCQTRYDEEILRFCTKDGTPLVDENPSFTEMPSEGKAEDIGEETLISMGRPKSVPPPDQPNFEEESAQRIVIPTSEPEKEAVRAKPLPPPQPPQQSSNTVWVVLATMFGTFTILAVLGGIWFFLSNRNSADANKNINVNTSAPNTNYNINLNTNSSSPANFNFNANANENVNANTNVNANLKSPTPTKTPTPTPSPTPPDANANVNSNSTLNLGNTNIMSRPTPSSTPSQSVTPTPRTSPTPTATPPQNVNVGIMNSRAVSLTKPAYPQAAKQANASGEVRVQISVDEGGNVTSARAISGHALLRSAAENAARQSRFNPVRIGDQTVSAIGIVVYNFINQ